MKAYQLIDSSLWLSEKKFIDLNTENPKAFIMHEFNQTLTEEEIDLYFLRLMKTELFKVAGNNIFDLIATQIIQQLDESNQNQVTGKDLESALKEIKITFQETPLPSIMLIFDNITHKNIKISEVTVFRDLSKEEVYFSNLSGSLYKSSWEMNYTEHLTRFDIYNFADYLDAAIQDFVGEERFFKTLREKTKTTLGNEKILSLIEELHLYPLENYTQVLFSEKGVSTTINFTFNQRQTV